MSKFGAARAAPAEEEGALWSALHGAGRQGARERLFALYMAYAKSIARRHFRDRSRGDLDLADLEQYAFEGLLEAIDRFDPARGAPFRAYASRRIAGNVLDGIRRATELREQLSWTHRMRQDRIRSLRGEGGSGHGSALETLDELAVGLALGLMLEDAGLLGGADDKQAAAAPPHAWRSLAWAEVKRALENELAHLGEREQSILRSHYMQGMAFEHIASLLGVSKGRISQIHRGALETLRKRMAAQGHFRLER